MSVSIDPDKPNYIGLINESVHTSDDVDIGDIYAINKYFLVVKRGFVNIHYYYIPLSKVEGWDGYVLWLKISEEVVKKYERKIYPDPLVYYIKGFSYESIPPYIPTVNVIPSKGKGTAATKDFIKTNESESIIKYRCDLCNIIFKEEDGLSKHVLENHN